MTYSRQWGGEKQQQKKMAQLKSFPLPIPGHWHTALFHSGPPLLSYKGAQPRSLSAEISHNFYVFSQIQQPSS